MDKEIVLLECSLCSSTEESSQIVEVPMRLCPICRRLTEGFPRSLEDILARAYELGRDSVRLERKRLKTKDSD